MGNGRTKDSIKSRSPMTVIENGGSTEKSQKKKGERQTEEELRRVHEVLFTNKAGAEFVIHNAGSTLQEMKTELGEKDQSLQQTAIWLRLESSLGFGSKVKEMTDCRHEMRV